jgi:hypothetical protein
LLLLVEIHDRPLPGPPVAAKEDHHLLAAVVSKADLRLQAQVAAKADLPLQVLEEEVLQ